MRILYALHTAAVKTLDAVVMLAESGAACLNSQHPIKNMRHVREGRRFAILLALASVRSQF